MKPGISKTAFGLISLVACLAAASGASADGNGPCASTAKQQARLLCPDLRIAKPSQMYTDRKTKKGRVLLRATNDIMSRGLGPMELRGRRDRSRSMNVTQAIARRSGGYALFPTQARLRFFNVGREYGGAYWKVAHPLHFELWKVNAKRRKTRQVREGPKQFYCFRDLELTKPGRYAPDEAVYPACSQNPKERQVTLGTSVGWSDIYPSTYDQQWIDVTGLKGCFAYLLRLDPFDSLIELEKKNNVSQKIVRLPFRKGRPSRC
ncbi:MAG: lysyl oxidase family protein [Solirubrobacterales bacterium]